MRLSASQLKTYKNNKAERAGKYLLGIRDNAPKSYFDEGTAFHKYMEFSSRDIAIEFLQGTQWSKEEKDNMIVTLDTLISNIDGYEEEKEGVLREEWVHGEIWGVEFQGFIDYLLPGVKCIDYKTTGVRTQIDGKPGFMSNMSRYDEYKLQAFIYMKLAQVDTCEIVEVHKKVIKKYGDEQYQILTFKMNDLFEKEMEEAHRKDIEDMIILYTTHQAHFS